MKHPVKIFSLLCMLFLLYSCYKEEVIFNSTPDNTLELPLLLNFNHKACSFDAKNNLLRFTIASNNMHNFEPFIEFNSNAKVEFNGKTLQNNEINQLEKIELRKEYPIQYTINGKEHQLKISFTNLPLIQITTESAIYDEPKVLARLNYIDSNTPVSDHFIGLEYRGKFSRDFPKKSFGFTLWKNGSENDEYSANINGSATSSDWVLNSSVIDPSRIRNAVSFQLWKEMESVGSTHNSPHYSIEINPVELFINNNFRGLYQFSENMTPIKLNASKNAVLYKGIEWSDGATRFERFDPNLSNTQFWNGWEQKYPDRKKEINWQPLKELYDLVVIAPDDRFAQEIGNFIDIPLFIDYFLLLNLCNAADNTGKNIFLFKPSPNEKFMIIPWDFDGSWGIQYDGKRVSANNMLTNNLYQRLFETNPDNYREILKNRWFELRATIFTENNITNKFGQYVNIFTKTDIIEMENQRWELSIDIQKEYEYIKTWVSIRLDFLDHYYSY